MSWKFKSEDDIKVFEEWMEYQAVDPASLTKKELAMWKGYFKESRDREAQYKKVGLMKLQRVADGEFRYAVAINSEDKLWLSLWVRRSPKGEFFVLIPRGDNQWNPHASYHLDGTLHYKSYDRKTISCIRQSLNGKFSGTENLGIFSGHFPKSVGAICDPSHFSGIFTVDSKVLGANGGGINVDLVEPGVEPPKVLEGKIAIRKVFREVEPWVVFTVWH